MYSFNRLIPLNYPKTLQLDLSLEYTFRTINVIYMWDKGVFEVIKVKYCKGE